jgi:predicted nucleic acid-binding protein
MIHLDTNYLIGLAVRGSLPAQNVDRWLAAGEPLSASTLAWTEFLNGPVSAVEIALVESVIEEKLVAFEKPTAVLAAELFNQGGRRRGSRFDCLIAATAILNGAGLATENRKDFEPFIPFGLKLL